MSIKARTKELNITTTMDSAEQIPHEERVKVAAFAFTTTLTSPIFSIPAANMKKATECFVKRLKTAHARHLQIKQTVRDFATAG